MRRTTRRTLLAACLLFSISVSVAAEEEKPPEDDLWTQAQALYEKAKAAGETVPDDIAEWVKADLGRIGVWEYKVAMLPSEPTALDVELNRLGAERWDCFWMERSENKLQVTCKRPAKSYLGSIKLLDLFNLVQGDGGE